jgi:hypothetical protein
MQMLHHGESRDFEVTAQLLDVHAGLRHEEVEDAAAVWIGDRTGVLIQTSPKLVSLAAHDHSARMTPAAITTTGIAGTANTMVSPDN